MTVVDYRAAEAQGVARAKQCPPGAETCIGTQDGRQGAIIGLGYWKMDVRGAMTFAALKFMQRDAKVTDLNLQFQQVVEGYFVQLTNRDESRTFAYITMHENRLYIFEGTTPKGSPEPALFQVRSDSSTPRAAASVTRTTTRMRFTACGSPSAPDISRGRRTKPVAAGHPGRRHSQREVGGIEEAAGGQRAAGFERTISGL